MKGRKEMNGEGLANGHLEGKSYDMMNPSL